VTGSSLLLQPSTVDRCSQERSAASEQCQSAAASVIVAQPSELVDAVEGDLVRNRTASIDGLRIGAVHGGLALTSTGTTDERRRVEQERCARSTDRRTATCRTTAALRQPLGESAGAGNWPAVAGYVMTWLPHLQRPPSPSDVPRPCAGQGPRRSTQGRSAPSHRAGLVGRRKAGDVSGLIAR
jgi:hypothetical protein